MSKFKKTIRKKTEKQLIFEFITLFKENLKKKLVNNQRFSFVLTGGTSPKKLYQYLSNAEINWNNIDLFLGDERYVKKNSKHSNFNLVKKQLINKIKIKKKNIFTINLRKKSAYLSALDYENKLKKYFKNKKYKFDFILFGMGKDGHIASIFPNNIDFNNKKLTRSITRNDIERITLNLSLINKSKNIFLWLNDKKKSNIFKVLKNKKKIPFNYLDKKKTYLFIRS